MNLTNNAELITYVNQGNPVTYVFFWGHTHKGGYSR